MVDQTEEQEEEQEKNDDLAMLDQQTPVASEVINVSAVTGRASLKNKKCICFILIIWWNAVFYCFFTFLIFKTWKSK